MNICGLNDINIFHIFYVRVSQGRKCEDCTDQDDTWQGWGRFLPVNLSFQ